MSIRQVSLRHILVWMAAAAAAIAAAAGAGVYRQFDMEN